MRKVWIVVANRGEMKLYQAENVHTLIEKQTLSHEESHLHTHDLVSDKQGSYHGRYGVDTLQERTDPKKKEAAHFATQIANLLEKGVASGEVERIYLFSSPEFMGHLRAAIKPHVAKIIEKEIDKDALSMTPEQILQYLPPAL